MKLNKNTDFNLENKSSRMIILYITITLILIYMFGLLAIFNIDMNFSQNSSLFIRAFNTIFSILAVVSCILCYRSTNKEELFIMSLMYTIFFIDLFLGNVDNLDLTIASLNMKGYIAISTSLMRVSILIIATFSFKNIKKKIIENPVLSIVIVFTFALCFGYLENQSIIFPMNKRNDFFINYNKFLFLVYIIVSVNFFIKSIKENEYIYSVISASILMFAIKAIYAIVGSRYPIMELKILSISITYVGFIIFIGGLFLELTLSIKRNKKLEEENKIFYTLIEENKNNCIYIYDEDKNLLYSNKKLKQYFFGNEQYTHNQLKNKIKELIQSVGDEKNKEISNHKELYGCWNGKVELYSGNVILDCDIQTIKMNNSDKKTVVSFTDITQKHNAEQSLIQYEKIKNHEKLKNEFFANISHELRTPLNIFYSTVQLLDMKCENINEDFRFNYSKHKQSLKINCQRMLRLINNIVDITKIDVGFTKANIINCDIVKLIEDITLSVIDYANPKDINIIFDTEVEEHIIKCDPEMIERAMLNLLSNAIKFTNSNGNILINIKVIKEWVQIIVKDDGIGIPINMQDLIFERFVQADKSLTRMNEGSGIGLSIVKSIIELNEGEIYLESDGKSGSEFEILLPNRRLIGDFTEEEKNDYEVDIQKIELELSDIYKLYE